MRFAALLLSLFLAIACGGSSVPVATPAATATPDPEPAYRTEVIAILTDFQTTSTRLIPLLQTLKWGDPSWQGQVTAALTERQVITARLRRLTPPPRLAAAHEKYLQAFDLLDQAAVLTNDGLRTIDAAKIEAASVLTQRATQILGEGTALIPSPR